MINTHNKELRVSKASTNLVMFEYIDQLLCDDKSEIKSDSVIEKPVLRNDLNAAEERIEKTKSNLNVQQKNNFNEEALSNLPQVKLEPINEKLTDFCSPKLMSFFSNELGNIEKDLAEKSEEILPKENGDLVKKDISIIQPEEIIEKKPIKSKSKDNSIINDELNSKSEEERVDYKEVEESSNQISNLDLNSLSEFDCVMVKLDSLLIAMPMTQLGTINKIQELPTKLPGKPEWFLGVQIVNENSRFNLIDTQDILFTPSQKNRLNQSDSQRCFSVNVYGTNWALACDEVIGSIRVENSQVQWRKNTTGQIIAGTIKDKMCMLINVDQLIEKVTKQNNLNDL